LKPNIRITLLAVALLAMAGVALPQDPNAPAPRRPLGFKVFNNMDRPVTGTWDLEIPLSPARRLEISEAVSGNPEVLVGRDASSGEEILRLTKKKEGIGFDGQLSRLLSPCGYDTLSISEFLPLGDSAVLRFEMTPPSGPCAPIDSGQAGKFFVFSRKGGPVKLRAFTDISASNTREAYSIGGDRPNTEVTTDLTPGGVSVDDGAELKFIQRVKAPLDGSFWLEVEAVLSPAAGVRAPRGFILPESVRFVGSLTLRRAR
jgi:hypothetical protein